MAIEREDSRARITVLRDRKFIACGVCGWLHYAMTIEEKRALDCSLSRYNLTPAEQYVYESGYRQCLHCEASVGGFRDAQERDLARATGHIITPVLIDND